MENNGGHIKKLAAGLFFIIGLALDRGQRIFYRH